MRKVQVLLLIFAFLLTSVGCSSSSLEDATQLQFHDDVHTDVPGVQVQIQEAYVENGETVLTVLWSNQTEYSVLYGEPYTIERLIDGKWVGTAKDVEGAVFLSIGYMLHAGQEQTKGYAVSWIFDVSAPGTYRFKTSCYVETGETAREECTLWAVFTVDAVQYSAQYIRTNGDMDSGKPQVEIMGSVQALQDYYTNYREKFDLERKEHVYADTTIGFLDACDRYNEAFFEKNYLVFVRLEEGSGSIGHAVVGVEQAGEKNLSIYIKRKIPEVCTDDMAQWHIMLELSRDLLVASADDISVYIR